MPRDTYSVLPAMLERFEHVQRSMGFEAKDRDALRSWRRRLGRKLKQLTGYDTFQRCELRPRTTESVPCEGYVRHRVEIDTEPSVTMPVYVLVPLIGRRTNAGRL